MAVTGALAACHVDERLPRSTDSPSTRRRKLSALAAFWKWMALRCYLPRGTNPWKGFRISSEGGSTKPKKRPYTMPELVQLFSGTPSYPALREVMVLGLYTGTRIDELCSITRGDARVKAAMSTSISAGARPPPAHVPWQSGIPLPRVC